MQQNKVKLITLFLPFIALLGLYAQETITASGVNAAGSGGTSSYTIGQVAYTATIGTEGSAAQGVQQPYEISVVNGFIGAKGIILNCSVYPNPTADYITFIINGDLPKQYTISLYDNSGRLLESKKVTGNETRIYLNNLVASIYFLKVNENNIELKTFKIIKIIKNQ
ncbi:MAG: T9SS type A sorting domain-containing protein [Bacteroidales bacterium]|nr:T9SS type A sorting domain-containing protein [Bacteroidales bacterium]